MRSPQTRLRFVKAKDAETIVAFFEGLGRRMQIYSINWDGKKWVCWFVPGEDDQQEIVSGDLDE